MFYTRCKREAIWQPDHNGSFLSSPDGAHVAHDDNNFNWEIFAPKAPSACSRDYRQKGRMCKQQITQISTRRASERLMMIQTGNLYIPSFAYPKILFHFSNFQTRWWKHNNLYNKPQPASHTFLDRKQIFEKNLLLVFFSLDGVFFYLFSFS